MKEYQLTDNFLEPLAGMKSMVNLSVEDGMLTDSCFPVFATMPKLTHIQLDHTKVTYEGILIHRWNSRTRLVTRA